LVGEGRAINKIEHTKIFQTGYSYAPESAATVQASVLEGAGTGRI
jgi:hypothetical protein